ncbi:MAG: FtsX-like permease family protein, partial [Spirochaetia bacterium]|nr:FtsX-like permease family protein [Spirochaetia bacterium]
TSLLSNKVRTFLTVLGIVIGIGSVISMISVGESASSSIESEINSVGSNFLTVTINTSTFFENNMRPKMLNYDDVEALLELENVDSAYGLISTSSTVSYLDLQETYSIMGIPNGYLEMINMGLKNGVFFNSLQNDSYAKVAIISPDISETLFENDDPIGKEVKINGTKYIILGVFDDSEASGMNDMSSWIFLPINTAGRFLTGNDAYSTMFIELSADADPLIEEEEIKYILERERGIVNKDEQDYFSIISQEDILELTNTIMGTLSGVLAAIAGISLLVGGIGIMNMMLTNVSERTKEIGLRKAIGAKNKEITNQFLLEAIVLTLIGGIIGILMGWGLSSIASSLIGFDSVLSMRSIYLGLGICTFIGIVFGYYPAKKASKLNPIDALRHE